MKEGQDIIKNLPMSEAACNESMSERIMLVMGGCYISHRVEVLNKMISSGDLAAMVPAGYINETLEVRL